ncbi:NUDIX domain-containing protein [Microtetraspora malaysiensis]|uniref:NUDIX domain-containing protein n=1 Tax=Microtetraspora malaysiensis TaxID=161358 RepID=UPI003D89BA2F
MSTADLPMANNHQDPLRVRLTRQVEGIAPWDDQESVHATAVVKWIASRAPLYRVRKPNVPDPHLVSYFVVLNKREELLLVAHRNAGLWLPSGGHVEPGEDPWETVARECQEELHIPATPHPLAGDRPFFITTARTRGEGSHVDVSLWYVLEAETVTTYDRQEFDGVRWVTLPQILDEPADVLDPHMHRFTRKLIAAFG